MEKSTIRSFRVRPEHTEVILEEAEKNPVLITMNFSKANARAHYNKSWSLLTARLNSLGYGDKSEDIWRRVLVDWISLTKSRYTKIKKDREKTGGGPPNNIQLNPQEERLMAIKGYSSVEGDGTTTEIGLLPTISTISENPIICETDSMPEDMQSTSHTYIHNDSIDQEDIIISVENMEPVEPKKKRHKLDNTSSRKSIEVMHEETLTELKDIKMSLRIIADSLKSVSESLIFLYSTEV